MTAPEYILAVVLIAASITFALRAIPFAVLRRSRGSLLFTTLSRRMPSGLMLLLVLYLLRGVHLEKLPFGVPELPALIVTLAIHAWRRNAILSIAAGTTVNMVLVN